MDRRRNSTWSQRAGTALAPGLFSRSEGLVSRSGVSACRGLTWLVLAAAFALLPACSSALGTRANAREAARAASISSLELAGELGLRHTPRDDAGRIVLVAPDGGRIALFTGHRAITVRGHRMQAASAIEWRNYAGWLSPTDVARIRTLWQETAPGARTGADPGGRRTGSDGGRDARNLTLPPPLDRRPRPKAAPAPRPTQRLSGSSANLPSREELRAWRVPLRRTWQYIVVHHSATSSGSASAFHEAHRKRDWDGLGYDFVIGNGNGSPDGRVEVGYRWREQRDGAHAGDKLMNQRGIGICLVGDFTKSRPTAAQMRALRRLCAFLGDYCGIPPQNLRRHSDFRDTACPGPNFPRDFSFAARPSGGRRTVLAHPAGCIDCTTAQGR
jgi:hypothetical protein